MKNLNPPKSHSLICTTDSSNKTWSLGQIFLYPTGSGFPTATTTNVLMFVLFRATGAEHHGGVPDRGQRVHPLQVRGDGRFLHLPGRPAPGPRTARHLPGQAGEAHQVAGCPSKPFHFDPVPASHDDGSGSSSSSLVKHFKRKKEFCKNFTF